MVVTPSEEVGQHEEENVASRNAGVGLAVFLLASLAGISAVQLPGDAVPIDTTTLAGL